MVSLHKLSVFSHTHRKFVTIDAPNIFHRQKDPILINVSSLLHFSVIIVIILFIQQLSVNEVIVVRVLDKVSSVSLLEN